MKTPNRKPNAADRKLAKRADAMIADMKVWASTHPATRAMARSAADIHRSFVRNLAEGGAEDGRVKNAMENIQELFADAKKYVDANPRGK